MSTKKHVVTSSWHMSPNIPSSPLHEHRKIVNDGDDQRRHAIPGPVHQRNTYGCFGYHARQRGKRVGFSSHELLEAALASRINMTLRMVADRHALPLAGVTTRVMLDQTDPEEGVFEYEIVLRGPLSQEDRDRLLDAAKKCPVRQTLSKRIGFRAR